MDMSGTSGSWVGCSSDVTSLEGDRESPIEFTRVESGCVRLFFFSSRARFASRQSRIGCGSRSIECLYASRSSFVLRGSPVLVLGCSTLTGIQSSSESLLLSLPDMTLMPLRVFHSAMLDGWSTRSASTVCCVETCLAGGNSSPPMICLRPNLLLPLLGHLPALMSSWSFPHWGYNIPICFVYVFVNQIV